MQLAYFSWIRERIGKNGEEFTPPSGVETVGQLIEWLKTRGEEYEHALAHDTVIRVAIDRQHVADRAASIAGAREIALFPPMTGG